MCPDRRREVKIMKRILALVIAAVTLVTVFTGCGAKKNDSDLSYIQGKKEMVIGITLFAPMNYYDSNKKLVGFETEFAEAVCEKLGVKPKFVEIKWDSKETELASKNIDCIWNGLTITDERKENMALTNPYMSNKQILVAKGDNAAKAAESVDGLAISAEQGSTGESVVNENEFFAKAKLTSVDDQAKALLEVESGVADAAVVDYVMSIGSIGEGTDYADLKLADKDLQSTEDYGIAFRKGSDTAAKVNEIISEFAADGTLKKIAEKYKLQDLVTAK